MQLCCWYYVLRAIYIAIVAKSVLSVAVVIAVVGRLFTHLNFAFCCKRTKQSLPSQSQQYVTSAYFNIIWGSFKHMHFFLHSKLHTEILFFCAIPSALRAAAAGHKINDNLNGLTATAFLIRSVIKCFFSTLLLLQTNKWRDNLLAPI